MQDNFRRAINLAKKTGDKLLVFDSSRPEDVYVVMSLNDYENLVMSKSLVHGLTEDQLLDKINRDIAIWKSGQEFKENLAAQSVLLDELTNNSQTENINKTRTDDLDKITRMEQQKPRRIGGAWSIPEQRKQRAEEVIEEDRQYLEDVIY